MPRLITAEFELKKLEASLRAIPEYEAYKARWKEITKWMKHTIARHTADGPQITYSPVDVSVMPPDAAGLQISRIEIHAEIHDA